MSNPLISIITPTYNSSKTIKETVESVLNQSFTDFEYIIIDDGSKDNTVEIIKSIDDPRIVLIEKENGGASSARNAGVKQAKADIIAFIDSDDLWLKDRLKIDYEIFVNSEYEEKALIGSFYMINQKNEITYISPLFNYNGFIDKEQKFAPHLFNPGSLMINKSIIEKLGYFKTDYYYHEDYDFGVRIIANYPIISSPHRLLLYRYYMTSKGRRCFSEYEDSKSYAHILRKFFEETSDKYDLAFQLEAIELCYRAEIFAILSFTNNVKTAKELYFKKLLNPKSYMLTPRGFMAFISVLTGINIVKPTREIIQSLYHAYYKLNEPLKSIN